MRVDPDNSKNPNWGWPSFILLTLAHIWLAHLIAFFAHEYAHTFTAWILGWKANPFDLHFPGLSLVVLAAQFGINQNVDDAAIFASGHGFAVATIALAGSLIGNAFVTFPLSRIAYRHAASRYRHGWAMLAFWVTVASVGNFIDYVPIRTFTPEGDMGSVQRGFGWSPWLLLLIFGVPTLIAVIVLLVRIVPKTLAWVFPMEKSKRYFIAILTALLLFGFYGAAGLDDGGPTSHILSILSLTVAVPLVILLEVLLVRRSG